MRYYVGSELGIANYIQRNFDVGIRSFSFSPKLFPEPRLQWSANSLFFEEIPNALDPKKTMFYLGGSDSILSAGVRPKTTKSRGTVSEFHVRFHSAFVDT